MAEVLVGWGHRQQTARLVRDCVVAVTGADPGPLFHTCPRCGSVEHGRPYVDADVHLSVAYAADVAVVAVCGTAEVGVDVETTGALERAGTDESWVRTEALLKAHGRGITEEPPTSGQVVPVDAPDGLVAAVAVLSPDPPLVRAAPGRAATPRTGR